jgi:hypothetical protein
VRALTFPPFVSWPESRGRCCQERLFLAETLAKLPGRAGGAIAEYQAMLRAQLNLAGAHYNYGSLLPKIPGLENDAFAEWSATVANDPVLAQLIISWRTLWLEFLAACRGQFAEWQSAVQYDPGIYQAHYNLGMALSRTHGRMGEAIGGYQAAFRLLDGLRWSGTHHVQSSAMRAITRSNTCR